MASMTCPSCGAAVNKLIYPPTHAGEKLAVFCNECRPLHGSKQDRKLYTGKKFWVENDVYSRDQVKEKNWEFERSAKRQVADQYKNMRPSVRKKMFGE